MGPKCRICSRIPHTPVSEQKTYNANPAAIRHLRFSTLVSERNSNNDRQSTEFCFGAPKGEDNLDDAPVDDGSVRTPSSPRLEAVASIRSERETRKSFRDVGWLTESLTLIAHTLVEQRLVVAQTQKVFSFSSPAIEML